MKVERQLESYMFPRINHIDDVLPHVKDSSEFLVLNRGPYTVINYVVVAEETFPSLKVAGGSPKMREERKLRASIRRECRGLIFDKNGKLISRPYHKFFNLNEREETLSNHVDFSRPHIVLEKLDGSMVRPVYLSGKMYWATRMGITDVAQDVAKYAENNTGLEKLCYSLHLSDFTPIFEWCSRKQQIVVDFPQDMLYLTAIRDIETGEYVSYPVMKELAEEHNVSIVPLFSMENSSTEELLKKLVDVENMEGVVVRFDDGDMIKVKTAWYALRHKSKDMITREKDVLDIILNNKLDDIKSFLEENDVKRLVNFSDKVMENIIIKAKEIYDGLNDRRRNLGNDRKRFALEVAQNIDPVERSIYYRLWDNLSCDWNDVLGCLVDFLKANISTKTKVEEVRKYWKGLKWSDF